MRRIVVIAGVMALAGCASQLVYDIGKADDPCRAKKFATKSELVACLTEHERPVWVQDEPQTLDIFDQYSAARASLAAQLDSGALTEEQYDKQLADTNSDFHARVIDRRAATPTKP
jgi:predicted RNA polymerase sigma factor